MFTYAYIYMYTHIDAHTANATGRQQFVAHDQPHARGCSGSRYYTPKEPTKRAVNSTKRAVYPTKRAEYPTKRAVYPTKRGPHVRKRAT